MADLGKWKFVGVKVQATNLTDESIMQFTTFNRKQRLDYKVYLDSELFETYYSECDRSDYAHLSEQTSEQA
jgi:hypothetical protein